MLYSITFACMCICRLKVALLGYPPFASFSPTPLASFLPAVEKLQARKKQEGRLGTRLGSKYYQLEKVRSIITLFKTADSCDD